LLLLNENVIAVKRILLYESVHLYDNNIRKSEIPLLTDVVVVVVVVVVRRVPLLLVVGTVHV